MAAVNAQLTEKMVEMVMATTKEVVMEVVMGVKMTRVMTVSVLLMTVKLVMRAAMVARKYHVLGNEKRCRRLQRLEFGGSEETFD
jgi:hypothetical protein